MSECEIKAPGTSGPGDPDGGRHNSIFNPDELRNCSAETLSNQIGFACLLPVSGTAS